MRLDFRVQIADANSAMTNALHINLPLEPSIKSIVATRHRNKPIGKITDVIFQPVGYGANNKIAIITNDKDSDSLYFKIKYSTILINK